MNPVALDYAWLSRDAILLHHTRFGITGELPGDASG